MVLVNDKEISVYKLDTVGSVKNRIASEFDTLPKYIIGVPETVTTEKKIKMKDILSIIQKNANKSSDFEAFLEKNKELIKDLKLKEDVLYVWLAYNKKLESLSEYSSIILDQIAQKLVDNGYFSSVKEFLQFWKNRKNIKMELEFNINKQKIENEKYTELYDKFEQIQDGLVYTEFKTEKVALDMVLDFKDITILEIFNYIILNEKVPFATCKNYCKILKDYMPSDEWKITSEDSIFLKINEKALIDQTKFKDYTDVKIGTSGDTTNATMKLVTERGYVSRDQFIDRFLSIFKNNKVSYTDINETEVIGTFYFPQERIDTYVFSDLVMNNPIFSTLINIDESTKATKKKTEFSQPWLYIHFNHPSTGHISAAISQKIVDRTDQVMRNEDAEIFPHGEPYIRVRVKGKHKYSIEFFQEIFSNLLVMYKEEYNEIVKIYQKYIPDFGIIEEIDVKPLKQSDLAPEIFVSNFSRYCAEPPTIVSDKEAKKYKKEGKQVMVFPRNVPESGPVYLSDGQNQHKYVCLNPDYPYPGLQVNTKLSNSKEFPYLPCCFKTNQQNKKGKHYRHYYFGEELETKEKKQQDLIVTDKILGPEKYGMLPKDLQKLFEVLDTDTNYKYIRVGVHRNPSSLLNAVMVGLHEQTGILELTDQDERDARLLQIRSELADKMNSVLARQSCYDMTTEQISENLNNPEVYMDPKLYTQMLENYFDCNIFLFNRQKMFLPRFAQSYYKQHRLSTCIFIYEHLGSESDNAKYPQCELIIRWNVNKKDDTEFFFPYEDKISRNINKVFRLLNESYVLSNKIPEIIFPLPDDINPVSQHIDTYGKTRCINLLYKNKNISLLTDPMPPLPVIEVEKSIYKTGKTTALEIIKNLGSNPVSQSIENSSTLAEINFIVGNVNVSIPIEQGEEPLKNVTIKYDINYLNTEKSALQIFNQNKKISRYVTEYMFWLFSNYIQRENITEITNKVLANFAKSNFLIDKKHQYNLVSKKFSLNNNVITRNGQLIVKNEEMTKRLMYVLKLFSIRDLKTLRSYHTRQFISQYYVDITDFEYHSTQVILQGEDSIDKWIQENRFSLQLHRNIQPGKTPYFFKNDLIDEDKVFLAQNANNLEMALSIAINWYRNAYNIALDAEKTTKKYAFILYSYINPENIKTIEIKGETLPQKIRLIGYKIEGIPSYTALLDLNNI